MRENLNRLEITSPVRPSGMVSVKIDSRTGMAANDSSKNTRFELFLEEHSPQQSSTTRNSTKPKETQLNEELF